MKLTSSRVVRWPSMPSAAAPAPGSSGELGGVA